MNNERWKKFAEYVHALDADVQREVQDLRVDDVVLQCALLEAERQEARTIALTRESVAFAHLVAKPLTVDPYVCPVCGLDREGRDGEREPARSFGCSAALLIHLVRCPLYRAEISEFERRENAAGEEMPRFRRPMGVPEPEVQP